MVVVVKGEQFGGCSLAFVGHGPWPGVQRTCTPGFGFCPS